MHNQEQNQDQPQSKTQSHQANIPTNSNTQHNSQPQWSAYSLALNIGFMIIIPILIFGIGGVLLDKYLDTFPIFVLVGFFLAMASGLLIVYKKSKDIIESLSKTEKQSQNYKSNHTN